MTKITKTTKVESEASIDFELDDVLEFIDSANQQELLGIQEALENEICEEQKPLHEELFDEIFDKIKSKYKPFEVEKLLNLW
jgi:hypothetical protein